MTSKIVVNNIGSDTGINTVTFDSNVERGTSNLHSVGVEVAGINVLGADTPIGTGSTIYDDGGARFSGVVTATSFSGSASNLTNLPVPTTITVADESSDTTCNPLFVTTTSGNLAPKTGTNLVFNSATGRLGTGSLFLGTGSNESKTQDGLIMERNSGDGYVHITAGRSGGNYSGFNFYVAGGSGVTLRHSIDYQSNFKCYAADGTTERLRITSDGKLTLNYAATPPSEDVMICTAGQASPGRLTLSHLSGGNRYGARLQSISGTNKGLIISELMNSTYTDLAKVNTEFGLKADNTCKSWLVYRSEAGNEGIIDDFNVASVNDEGTGTFYVNLDRNIHRHGNGFSQSIVFGCYNDGSRQLIAGIGYAPSHGSNNPWWDVEDNGCRVQTQRSTDGTVVDAKVFSLAMYGDTGDLSPT